MEKVTDNLRREDDQDWENALSYSTDNPRFKGCRIEDGEIVCIHAIQSHSGKPSLAHHTSSCALSQRIGRNCSCTLVLRRLTAASWRMVYEQEELAAEEAQKLVSSQL